MLTLSTQRNYDLEEPYAGNLHVRVCGGSGRITARFYTERKLAAEDHDATVLCCSANNPYFRTNHKVFRAARFIAKLLQHLPDPRVHSAGCQLEVPGISRPFGIDTTQALAYNRDMGKSIRASAAALGSRGGRAGVGASKRRGDSEFYRRLVAQRKDRKVTGTGMQHRHLNHQDYTAAAIDDIISNGQRAAWERLRLAMLQEGDIREKILRVCKARIHEPSAQRHHFWRHYVQVTRAAP